MYEKEWQIAKREEEFSHIVFSIPDILFYWTLQQHKEQNNAIPIKEKTSNSDEQ